MTVRLLLMTAPVSLEERYGKFAGAANTEPSFGLICLASAAKAAGYEVHVVEAAANDLSIEAAAKAVRDFDPKVLGISATTVGITAAGKLADQIKTPGGPLIVVGGCHASSLPKETLETFPSIDMLVIGEGEATLVDILEHVESEPGRHPWRLAGTAERQDDTIIVNPPRDVIQDLDQLPLPDWSLLPGFPKLFHPSPARVKRWPCASIVLTRGCPNKCTFCDRSVFGRHCRSYSPGYALKLLEDLRTRHGVREVLIEDDTFIIRKDNVRELCNRILETNLDITWSCLGRADRVDLDLLKLMRRAGCWHISYGIESGDAGILETVEKHLNLDQIRQAATWSRQAGLMTKGFFMVGFPGETDATLEATRRLALELPLDDISVMQLTPFPGSEIFASADESGAFERDWRSMNTLNTVYVPKGMTKATLEKGRRRIIRDFYLRPRIIAAKLRQAFLHPRMLWDLLKGFFTLFKI